MALEWLAEQGGYFVLPKGRTKGNDANGKPTMESDWQHKPYDLSQALTHAAEGNNVGLITGSHSGGIIALDLDRACQAVVESLGPHAETAKVVRTNAHDRVKLLYRVNSPVESTSWKPQGWKPEPGEKNSPWVECLSDGRCALIPPSQFEGGDYILVDQHFGIVTLSKDAFDYIWYMATEGRADLPLFDFVRVENLPQHTSSRLGKRVNKETVLRAWTTLEVFEYHGWVTETSVESNGDLRLQNNGGLLIKPNDEGWYCFSAQQGGGDAIAAWAFCTRGESTVTDSEFWDVLWEMAVAKGLVSLLALSMSIRNVHG